MFSSNAITALSRELNTTASRVRALEAAALSNKNDSVAPDSKSTALLDSLALLNLRMDRLDATVLAQSSQKQSLTDLAARMDRLDAALDAKIQESAVIKALTTKFDRLDAAVSKLGQSSPRRSD
jgi:hypothetical protein